jgi:uncharacterized protein (TIGR03437 family)
VNVTRNTLFSLWLAIPGAAGLAQSPPPTVLQIDVENLVRYTEDVSDPSKFGTLPGPVAPVATKNLTSQIQFGDIVAVNGQPVKGTYSFLARGIGLVASDSGVGVFDAPRTAIKLQQFEILNFDGSAIGTIMMSGLTGGSPPPGAPLAGTGGNVAVIGGTGAFLGVRGEIVDTTAINPTPTRSASLMEDPANRRKNGGGKTHNYIYLVPISWPQIVSTHREPFVMHADGSVVTLTKPAVAGEVLTLHASGLGPTRPGVDPGHPFPIGATVVVNSPVQVTVDGQPAEVVQAIGSPGAVDRYEVSFRVPAGTATGEVSMQVSAAWIAGPAVTIPVQ